MLVEARSRSALVLYVLVSGLGACGESGRSDGPSAAGAGMGGNGGDGGSAQSGGSSGTGAGQGGTAGGVSGRAGAGGQAGAGRGGAAGAGTGGVSGSSGGATGGSAGKAEPPLLCAPLAAPSGDVIDVTPEQADELPSIVRDAPEGATIVLANGTYLMTGADEASRRIQIVSDGVTLRGGSGDWDDVVIDGEYLTEEIITVSASRVTIADLTVKRAVHHPIHVTGGPDGDTMGVVLHHLQLVDGGEQFVKINTSGATPNTYTDDGVVDCSLFELTAAGRDHVVPEPGGCYTGGIDGHQARGWAVRQNVFSGIHCDNGSLAEHAVHFWTSSRDTLVEQNLIIECARGIGFGLGDGGGNPPDRSYADDPYPGIGYVGHYDGVIRNNVIAALPDFEYFDTGIELEQARGTRVLHNTVLQPTAAFASISHRFSNSMVTLENNLVGSIRARDGSVAAGDSNLEGASDALFSDQQLLDWHLLPGASTAVNQAVVLPDAGDDIDGQPHTNGPPDIGADEVGPL